MTVTMGLDRIATGLPDPPDLVAVANVELVAVAGAVAFAYVSVNFLPLLQVIVTVTSEPLTDKGPTVPQPLLPPVAAAVTWPGPAAVWGGVQPVGIVSRTCEVIPKSLTAVNVNVSVLVLLAFTVVELTDIVPSPEVAVAPALYGPTNGPPLPTGAVPAGWIASVLVSERARAMLTRPLPV